MSTVGAARNAQLSATYLVVYDGIHEKLSVYDDECSLDHSLLLQHPANTSKFAHVLPLSQAANANMSRLANGLLLSHPENTSKLVHILLSPRPVRTSRQVHASWLLFRRHGSLCTSLIALIQNSRTHIT